MPRSSEAITNFTTGFISEEVRGRFDTKQYRFACKQLDNFIVRYYGGAEATPGTVYSYEVKDSSKKTVLLPFIFSSEVAYLLEFGENYIRFYKDGVQLESGGSPYEVVTTYLESDLENIRYVGAGDLLYLVDGRNKPKVLSRFADTNWTFGDFNNVNGPVLNQNITTTLTITPSAASGTGITLTASSSLFQSGHVGSTWKIKDGYVTITAYTSGTVVTADVVEGTVPTTATYEWSEAAWSGVKGYPSCLTFFEQRLFFAATVSSPRTIWGSKVASYNIFTKGTADNDAVTYPLPNNRINKTLWLEANESFLAIGTTGEIGKLWSGSDSNPLSPGNVSYRTLSSYGGEAIDAILVGDYINYVQRKGVILRELVYVLDRDGYVPLESNILSRDLTTSGVKQMAYQQLPDNILWCVCNDGTIATLTRNSEQGIQAWHRQITDGSYESLAVIPASGQDRVWVIVNRTIDGNTKRYIEYFSDQSWSNIEDYNGSHSSVIYNGVETTTITGLSHLEGKTVSILADGSNHPTRTVTSGEVTLSYPVTKAVVGLPRQATLETIDIEAGSATGNARSKIKRIYKVDVNFYKTVGAKIGRGTTLDVIPFGPAEYYDTRIEHQTGLFEVAFPKGYGKDSSIKIVQDSPLPITITGIYPFMETYDG